MSGEQPLSHIYMYMSMVYTYVHVASFRHASDFVFGLKIEHVSFIVRYTLHLYMVYGML